MTNATQFHYVLPRLSSPCRQKSEWLVLVCVEFVKELLLNGDGDPVYNEEKIMEMIVAVVRHSE